MKTFLTIAWTGLAALSLIGGIATLAVMAGIEDGLMSGLATRGLYLITVPITLITIGLVYRFMLDRSGSTGVGVMGIIHFILSFIGTLVTTGAWYYESMMLSGANANYELMGLLFGVSGVIALFGAIVFLVAVIIALNTRAQDNVADTYS